MTMYILYRTQYYKANVCVKVALNHYHYSLNSLSEILKGTDDLKN
jgi:hypothetical protein